MLIFKQALILLLALFFKLVDLLSDLRTLRPFSKGIPGLPIIAKPFSKFQDLPSELLSTILDRFSPREKLVISRTCRHWNKVIVGSKANWRWVDIRELDSIETAIHILRQFSELSNGSLRVVLIETKIVKTEDLMEIIEILEESWNCLRILHLTQDSKLNTMTREFARCELPLLAVLSTRDERFSGPSIIEDFKEMNSSREEETSGTKSVNVESDDGSELSHYYTDSLLDVEEEDLIWMNQVEALAFKETESTSSFYKVLLNVKDSIRQLHLTLYHIDGFEKPKSSNKPGIEFPALEFMGCSLFIPGLIPSNWFFPSLSGLGGSSGSLLDFNPETLQQISHLEITLSPIIMESLILSDVLESCKHLKNLVLLLFNNPKVNNAGLKGLLFYLNLKIGQDDSTVCPTLSSLHLVVTNPDELDLEVVVNFKRKRNLFVNMNREGMAERGFNVTFDSPELTTRFKQAFLECNLKEDKEEDEGFPFTFEEFEDALVGL